MALTIFRLLLYPAADPAGMLVLDGGGKGPVHFNHAVHVKSQPDPLSPHPAPANATCAGCHHSRDARGILQLAKCGQCHGSEGDVRNPRSRDFDEMHRTRAFHEKCIGCHVDLAGANPQAVRGPIGCPDCHSMPARGKG